MSSLWAQETAVERDAWAPAGGTLWFCPCVLVVMLPSESIARCLLVPYSLVYDQIPAKLTAALPVLSALFRWSLISI